MFDSVLVFSLCVLFGGLGALVFLVVVAMRASTAKDPEAGHETRKIFVATGCLLGLGFLFIEAMVLYYFGSLKGADSPDIRGAGKEVCDACTTVLPPIATLILGYYFGTARSSKQHETAEPQSQRQQRETAREELEESPNEP